jgi:hypothetical protein
MTTSKYRGRDIEILSKDWVYSDTKESVHKAYKTRSCGKCGNHSTKEGHDSCLGTLKGIMNACCGHGDREETYIQFLDGTDVRGEDARIIIDILKKHA